MCHKISDLSKQLLHPPPLSAQNPLTLPAPAKLCRASHQEFRDFFTAGVALCSMHGWESTPWQQSSSSCTSWPSRILQQTAPAAFGAGKSLIPWLTRSGRDHRRAVPPVCSKYKTIPSSQGHSCCWGRSCCWDRSWLLTGTAVTPPGLGGSSG